jgi:chromosome segregation ATPase
LEAVKETLTQIQSRVSDSQKVSSEAQKTFTEIAKKIGEINLQIKSINEATLQQESGIQQSNLAMKEMDEAAQLNNQSSNSVFRNSVELKGESERLKLATETLALLVSGVSETKSSAKEYQKPFTKKAQSKANNHNKYNEPEETTLSLGESSNDELESLAKEIVAKKGTLITEASDKNSLDAEQRFKNAI